MPAKIWHQGDQGLYSQIETDRIRVWTPEEHRAEAEELDYALDSVLDHALARVQEQVHRGAPVGFLRAWAVGSALRDSHVFESPALKNERSQLLWKALSRKCRTGARSSDGEEPDWMDLRPKGVEEPRREGGRLDYFEMCRWLAEQDFDDGLATFGGHVRNVWQMLERPSLRPMVLRQAFLRWLYSLSDSMRERCVEPKIFPELMKVLRKRWPDRGPGSAKRPVHYEEETLAVEIGMLLNPHLPRSA